MASGESHIQEDTAAFLMREVRTKQNAHFLQRMSAFKLHDELPDRMNALLEKLDRVERGGGGGSQSGALGAASGPER